MPSEHQPVHDDPDAGPLEVDLGHPRGTLAIVLIYAALFAVGWLGLYLGLFAPRGLPGG